MVSEACRRHTRSGSRACPLCASGSPTCRRPPVRCSPLLEKLDEIGAVARLHERLRQCRHLRVVDEPHAPGDLFRTADLKPLAMLDRADEGAGFEQRVVAAGIEPGEATPEGLDEELTAPQ